MPIYEFECKACEGEFETLVRSGGVEAVRCPSCGSRRVLKLFSAFATKGGSGSSCGACRATSCRGCASK